MCFSYIAYPLPVIVRGIYLFDNFEKLSMLVGLLRDILEGWARGCCVHVFLVVKSVNGQNEITNLYQSIDSTISGDGH